uniref:Cyclin N-terminal domain-containing protein n=1 Tax=Caenorhabditis japonica TaxID=281687 RepID=A0A8R1DWF5_CAEJA
MPFQLPNEVYFIARRLENMLRAQNNRRNTNDNNAFKVAQKPANGPLKPVNAQNKKESLISKPAQPSAETAQLTTKRVNLQDNEMKCLEMAEDIYKYLTRHEKKFVLDENFMNGGEPTSKMRRILVDWLIQVHLRFHLLPETLHLTVFILDQMLAKKNVSKADLQLLGISAMFVASKFEEVFLPDIYDYEFITENTFNKKQILAMEQTILNTLQFDLSCPSSLVFSRCISRVLSEDEEITVDQQAFFYTYNISKLIGELALLESVMTSVPRSHIAIAAMIIALEAHPVEGIEPKRAEATIIEQLGAARAEISETVQLLAQVAARNFKQAKLVAIKNKYQSSKLGQVSNLLTDDIIEKIEQLGE